MQRGINVLRHTPKQRDSNAVFPDSNAEKRTDKPDLIWRGMKMAELIIEKTFEKTDSDGYFWLTAISG